jgi:Phage integrase family
VLRASQLCDLRWNQVEFGAAVLHVRRVKSGTPSTHPLRGDELRALRRLQRESEPSPFAFVSERRSPFTTAGFARMVERAAAVANLELKAHPHMLRHACSYALANKGHDTRAIQAWLGLRSIASTAIYTALRRTGSRTPGGTEAQRTEAIKWAMPYPPMMTAAKLPATTARRNAAVMVYSMKDSVVDVARTFGVDRGCGQSDGMPHRRRTALSYLLPYVAPR